MGNKIDRVEERAVSTAEAQAWCRRNGNIPHFETSATMNTSVDEAFMTIIKQAIDMQNEDDMQMPDSIGGVETKGNIQLSARVNSQVSPYKRKKKCKC